MTAACTTAAAYLPFSRTYHKGYLQQVSLDWWNFEEAVLGFFLHRAAVAGMLISVSYHTARLLRGAHPASGPAVAQRLDQQGQGR